jgi:hypothetical protein
MALYNVLQEVPRLLSRRVHGLRNVRGTGGIRNSKQALDRSRVLALAPYRNCDDQ